MYGVQCTRHNYTTCPEDCAHHHARAVNIFYPLTMCTINIIHFLCNNNNVYVSML